MKGEVPVDEGKLFGLLAQHTIDLGKIGTAHLALEKLVLALVEAHPAKAALLARFTEYLEADSAIDLPGKTRPEVSAAADAQRERLMRAVQQICSALR